MEPTREMTLGASGAPTWMICETSRLNAKPSFERTVIDDELRVVAVRLRCGWPS